MWLCLYWISLWKSWKTMLTCRLAHIICYPSWILPCRHADIYLNIKWKWNMWRQTHQHVEGLQEDKKKGNIFPMYMYMEIIGKLLADVMMSVWNTFVGDIWDEIDMVLLIAAVLMHFHMGYSYWILIWKTCMNYCTIRWQLSVAILIMNAYLESSFWNLFSNTFVW